jgi:hypothetical protein
MFSRSLLAVFICVICLICLIGAVPAIAADCPTTDSVEAGQRIADALTCDASMQLLVACQLGSSGDVALSQIVIEKCESDFLTSLSKSARATYDRKAGACGNRFAGQSGTMYQSIRAICAAEVAHIYASRAAKAKQN